MKMNRLRFGALCLLLVGSVAAVIGGPGEIGLGYTSANTAGAPKYNGFFHPNSDGTWNVVIMPTTYESGYPSNTTQTGYQQGNNMSAGDATNWWYQVTGTQANSSTYVGNNYWTPYSTNSYNSVAWSVLAEP